MPRGPVGFDPTVRHDQSVGPERAGHGRETWKERAERKPETREGAEIIWPGRLILATEDTDKLAK